MIGETPTTCEDRAWPAGSPGNPARIVGCFEAGDITPVDPDALTPKIIHDAHLPTDPTTGKAAVASIRQAELRKAAWSSTTRMVGRIRP